MNTMATTLTEISIRARALATEAAKVDPDRPRHITFKAARAMERLGHAIEYLSDQYVDGQSILPRDHAILEAVQLLMVSNHQIYFDCPPVRTLRERWQLFLHPHQE
jgi:hypothetical protein